MFLVLLIGAYISWQKNQKFIQILYVLFFFGIVSLIIHKNPPFHYFMPIYVLPIILISHIVTSILETKKEYSILTMFGASVVIINLYYIFSTQYLFATNISNSYSKQKEVAEYIIKDAQGKPFELKRIGPFDNYPNEFKDNYEYLMWWLGNRPRTGPRTQYIIVEDKNMVPKELQGKDIKNIENVIIFRHTVQK